MSPVGLIAIGFLLFELLVIVASIYATVRIISKAGYSGWLVLLTLIPFVNIVMFFVFAFSKWPIEGRLEAAELASRGTWGGPTAVPPRGGWGAPVGGPSGSGPASWDYLSRS
jgi:hypothetical protein